MLFARKATYDLRARAGYTIVEMLAALAVVTLMSVMVATGVSAGTRAYARSQFSSQSEMLAATIDSTLSDMFRFMRDDGAAASTFVVEFNGEDISLSKGASALVSKDGRLYLHDSEGNDHKLVNDGI